MDELVNRREFPGENGEPKSIVSFVWPNVVGKNAKTGIESIY